LGAVVVRNGLLEMSAVRLSYGGRAVLDGMDLRVGPGEICALMGLSGMGKTSVLRAVAALQPFDEGRIVVDGFELRPGPIPPQSRLRALRGKVGMVFQQHALFEHLTALENVTLALRHVLGASAADAARRAGDLLETLEVASRGDAYPRALSGGEAQRVAIARALALDPRLLLLDEPTASLDPARRDRLGRTLRRLAGDERGLLVATHDVAFARGHVDRAFVLADGKVVEQGRPDELLDRPSHEATRRLLQSGDVNATPEGERSVPAAVTEER
jgi:polar amino acid transport system ATP-binding protein